MLRKDPDVYKRAFSEPAVVKYGWHCIHCHRPRLFNSNIVMVTNCDIHCTPSNHVGYTPNANMADHSVVARDELHESEVSQSLMFCFDNASPEKSCFVVDLFCFISLCLRVAVFLNATRKDRNLPPFTSKGK